MTQKQPVVKAPEAPKKSALELLWQIQDIVKRSNERNYGDGERKF